MSITNLKEKLRTRDNRLVLVIIVMIMLAILIGGIAFVMIHGLLAILPFIIGVILFLTIGAGVSAIVKWIERGDIE